MEKKLQAVYTEGVLRLEEPLQLKEMQQVVVTVSDLPAVDDDLSGYFTPEEWAKAARDPVTWEDVKQALSKISGCLSDTVTAQRQER